VLRFLRVALPVGAVAVVIEVNSQGSDIINGGSTYEEVPEEQ
jgi:hypothetical protein